MLIRPAAHQFAADDRPMFVVGINDIGRQPVDFKLADVQATQVVNNQVASLQVITFEELQTEERNRQIARAVLVRLAAGANAAAASQQGYHNRTSTVYANRCTYQVHSTGHSPTASAIAQANVSVQNEAMIQQRSNEVRPISLRLNGT